MNPNPSSHKVELVQSSDASKYVLNSRPEILFILRELLRRGAMITAFFNEGNDHFLTTLLIVDTDTLVLDWGRNEEMNRKALASRKIVFIANHDKVKVQFICPGLKEVQFLGRPAFRAATPSSVMRLQRREYYRLATPVSRPVKCMIPASERFSLREAEASVLDISNGGVALLAPPEGVVLKVGLAIENCRIVLPDMGTLHTALQIRNAFDVTLENGNHVRRFGCQFTNVDGTAMNLIQRYIIRVERDRRAKETGLV
ncbi:MAG: flagellar brake protein [Rhodocyclaceae bacterium]|nr:flagellar brake protein [Rhodocyclaceae bacterium]